MLVLKKYIVFSFFFTASISLFSQGLVESSLSVNPSLVRMQDQGKGKGEGEGKDLSIYDTISLLPIKGLLDDFSYDGPFPDTAIWLDQDVFINRGYGKSPITIGVATFDGLNEKGYPYNFVVSETSSNSSDSLTSKPIHLEYAVADSLYLSFFCQPQGRGEKPETADSLVLEFKGPGPSSPWNWIWSKEGSTLAKEDSTWTRVMIPIVDTTFLKAGFQFRFRNYATQSGNLDHWHIDYVYLNTLRTYSDTVFSDISWVYDGQPLLENYSNMPWKQYNQSELRTNFLNIIRNNYDTTQFVDYKYLITDDLAVDTIATFNGTVNILSFDSNKVYTDCDVPIGCINSVPITTTLFPSTLTGPNQFTVNHFYDNTIGDFNFKNDTLRVVQNFSNYYSYDDGSAENAIGLNVLDAQLAEKYSLNVEDTLQAIDIYFNPIVENASLYAFYLNVWNDAGGIPGSPIYTSSGALSPIYEQTGQNSFARYVLDAPLLLSPGTYYVGFTQKTNQFLNVGQDKNNNHQDKTFYNVGDGWLNSELEGSVMIHPLFGMQSDYVGIEDPSSINENSFVVYPNPAKDKLYIQLTGFNSFSNVKSILVDMYGRKVMEDVLNSGDFIDVSSVLDGIYFITLRDGGLSSTQKIIIIK